MYGQQRGNYSGYGSSYALGDLGFSIGGALKKVGGLVKKVALSPVKTVAKVGETLYDVARLDFDEAGRDIVQAGKNALPAAAVAGAVFGGAFLAPLALNAGKVVVSAVKGGAVSVLKDARSIVSGGGAAQDDTVLSEAIPPRAVTWTMPDLSSIFNPAYANMNLSPLTKQSVAATGPVQMQNMMEAQVGGVPIVPLAIAGAALLLLANRK